MRFTVAQLLMAVALFGIGLLFLQSEGCGTTYHRISHIEFSPDGKCLAVVHYSYRNANVHLKAYVADITRVVELISIEGGDRRTLDICRLPGNRGPFHTVVLGPEIAFSASHNSLAVILQDLKTVRVVNLQSGTQTDAHPNLIEDLIAVRCSPEGDVLVLGEGLQHLSRWNFSTIERIGRRVVHGVDYFQRYRPPGLMVGPEAERAVLSDGYAASQIDLLRGKETRIRVAPDSHSFVQLHRTGSSALFVSEGSFSIYQLDTDKWIELQPVNKDLDCLATSSDLTRALVVERNYRRDSRIYLADLHDDEVRLSELATNWATAAAFSPVGSHVAFNNENRIEVRDTTSKQLVATFRVDPRHRFPWTVPIVALTVWVSVVVWRLRARRRAKFSATRAVAPWTTAPASLSPIEPQGLDE